METLGQSLKNIREEKGFTCEQIAESANAKVEHIRAIEEDNIHNRLAATYAKGFIKAYCEFLGIDSIPVMERFTNEYLPSTEKAAAPRMDVLQQRGRSTEKRKLRILVGAVLIAALLIVLIVTYRNYFWSGTTAKDISGITADLKPLPEEPAATEAFSSRETPAPKLSFQVEALEVLSAKVYDDEEVLIDAFSLMKGERSREYFGTNKLILELDNGSAAVITSPDSEPLNKIAEGKVRLVLTEKGFEVEKQNSPISPVDVSDTKQ